MIASWQKSNDKPRQCVEKQRHYSADKGLCGQGYGLPSGHVYFWELDCKESWEPKNWCLKPMVLEKTPESPLGSKAIKPVNLKGNQPWILVWRSDAEAEAPVFWSSDRNSRLIGKVSDAGKDWGQKEKRASEDEMAGCITSAMDMNSIRWWANSSRWWGTGELACCSQWGCKVLDMTRWLNNHSSIDMSISVSEFIPTLLPLLVSICFSSLSLKQSEKNSQDNKALDHMQGHLLQRKQGVEYS